MTIVDDFLGSVTNKAYDHFRDSRSVLSFSEYIMQVMAEPHWHIRSSAQYFSDMIKKSGSYEISHTLGKFKRYKIFDECSNNNNRKIYGHEIVQQSLVHYIENFVRAGRTEKLLLLHGPNGSAKTSIVQAMASAAEIYSYSSEGALYQFSWIFPKKDSMATSMGFSKPGSKKVLSFAHLSNDEIESQVFSEERDHPLFLLSSSDRQALNNSLTRNSKNNYNNKLENFNFAQCIQTGELSHKNRQIYDALLASYSGDLSQVLRHVRVERFYLSRRYKRGMSVVEPQVSVDAAVRQLTANQSMSLLPSSLRHLNLFEVMGPLVESNRGLIEYSDLLKRPIESWKYLLVACEQSQVSMGSISLFFDLLMIATSNELHLSSFKEYPDWQSFKGRIELIRVPYLLRWEDEKGIYLDQIPKALKHIHVAPHSIEMAAHWAVLTRLEPPAAQKYPQELQEIIRDLSPEEKLDLYDLGQVPVRLSQKQGRDLKNHVKFIFEEYQNDANYEGRFGASPREILGLLLDSAQESTCDHLAVTSVFKHIERLIEQKSSYEFLRREQVRGYRDAKYLLELTKNKYLSILQDEVRSALGLYSKESYDDLFNRYVTHVSAWTKRERVFDQALGRSVDADENFMKKIESRLKASSEEHKDFRHQLIAEIGAFKLENPQIKLDFSQIFASHLRRFKESVYLEQQEVVIKVLKVFIRGKTAQAKNLDDKDVQRAQTLREGLFSMGYNASSAYRAMAYVLQNLETREPVLPEPGQQRLDLG